MIREFVRKCLVATAIVLAGIVLLLGLWAARTLVLLFFAGILFAILLRGLTNLLKRWLHLPDASALALVILLLTAIGVAIGVLAAPTVVAESDRLIEELPRSIAALKSQISQFAWGRQLLEQAPAAAQIMPAPSDMISRLGGAFTAAFGFLANLVIATAIGIFVAADPGLYLRGFLLLVPSGKRKRVEEVFHETGDTLRWWLIGRLSAMTLVGICTWIGLILLGVPLALPLSLLVMLLGFIPNLGPILAGIPAILIAMAQRPLLGLYVALLYLFIQMLEGYGFTPLIQQRTIRMPPALLISAIVVAGLLFGFLGMLLATPITATLLVFVKRFYLEDVLGER